MNTVTQLRRYDILLLCIQHSNNVMVFLCYDFTLHLHCWSEFSSIDGKITRQYSKFLDYIKMYIVK